MHYFHSNYFQKAFSLYFSRESIKVRISEFKKPVEFFPCPEEILFEYESVVLIR